MSVSHDFLNYQHAECHFVYAFMWRAYKKSASKNEEFEPTDLSRDVFRLSAHEYSATAIKNSKLGDWTKKLLHERHIGHIDDDPVEEDWVGAYQPTFVTKRAVLQFETNPESAQIIVPLGVNIDLPRSGSAVENGIEDDVAALPVRIQCTMRLFETFTGTLSVRVSIDKAFLPKLSNADRYRCVHWLLHLTTNMDDEGQQPNCKGRKRPITDSFLFQKHVGTFRLFDYMRNNRFRGLDDFPKQLFSQQKAQNKIWVDSKSFAFHHSGRSAPEVRIYENSSECEWRENQSPFIVTNLVVGDEAWQEIVKPDYLENANADRKATINHANRRASCELAAIYTRLTLENHKIPDNFLNISFDYLNQVLGFDLEGRGLPNLCLDDRVFFGFSKRGALTLTHVPEKLPAVFVIPSFLNLFEILRTRTIAGIVITSELSDLAAELGRIGIDKNQDTKATYTDQLKNFRNLRQQLLLQQQNPIHFLFDGGSVTELALAAERELFVSEIIKSAEKGVEIVEALFSIWNLEQSYT